jgi:hypothetical protein
MSSNEIMIWWAASVALIGAGVVSAVFSSRRQIYLASMAAAGSGALGMLYALRLMMITGA